MAHPTVVLTPEFYNEKTPYYVEPFHIGQRIYVISPDSQINTTKVE
jgi:hypothetical protein